MSLAEGLLVAMCIQPNNAELQACQALAKATYSTNKDYFAKIDEAEHIFMEKLPVWVKHTIVCSDAINKQYVYIPLIDRKF